MVDSFPNLDSGNGRKIGLFILLRCLSWKRDSSWGEILWFRVHIVCDMVIRGGGRGTITTWCRRGYNVIHMVLGLMETVSSNGSLIFEIWVDIQGRGGVGIMVLKVESEDLDRNVNSNQEGFFLDEARMLFR